MQDIFRLFDMLAAESYFTYVIIAIDIEENKVFITNTLCLYTQCVFM